MGKDGWLRRGRVELEVGMDGWSGKGSVEGGAGDGNGWIVREGMDD